MFSQDIAALLEDFMKVANHSLEKVQFQIRKGLSAVLMCAIFRRKKTSTNYFVGRSVRCNSQLAERPSFLRAFVSRKESIPLIRFLSLQFRRKLIMYHYLF